MTCVNCENNAGIFSRSAVNFNAGCKTAMSNVVMSIAVMITLLLLIPLFRYTPLVVLAAIIFYAMLGLLKYEEVVHLWKVDKFDFVICFSTYIGVVFGSVDNGLIIAISLSVVKLLLVVARPKTYMLGNLPNTMSYRSMEQYGSAKRIAGILILQIEGPINFACSNYLRERIGRWVYEEEDRIQSSAGYEPALEHVILDLGAVGSIDTSGIGMLQEVRKFLELRGFKLILANPGNEVIKKMYLARCIDDFGEESMYPTVCDAGSACRDGIGNCSGGIYKVDGTIKHELKKRQLRSNDEEENRLSTYWHKRTEFRHDVLPQSGALLQSIQHRKDH
ncbi:hypothetical protein KSS87_020882 [Heliosperma pusillum]|nr:hypothetical protein KSS87_020882 [Heliosperma pusillum]